MCYDRFVKEFSVVPRPNNETTSELSPNANITHGRISESIPDSRRPWLSRSTYVRVAEPALLLYCLTAALSVALTQCILIPLIFYWLAVALSERGEQSQSSVFVRNALAAPITTWFGVCLLSALWGAETSHSISETLKSGIFLLLPFAVASTAAWSSRTDEDILAFSIRCLTAFAVGQTVAAIHTALQLGAGFRIPELVPGAVTESGQLTLILPLVLGLFVFARPLFRRDPLSTHPSAKLYFGCAAIILLAWPFAGLTTSDIPARGPLSWIAAGASLTALSFFLRQIFHYATPLKRYVLTSVRPEKEISRQILLAAAFLLGGAFVLNLKRGPWLGVFLEILFFGMLYSRKLVLWSIGGGLAVLFLLTPVRARLEGSLDDFSIQGGRQNMWSMGLELVQSFPLGIGFGNSRLMRTLDPTLPPRHRHMHNNVLQVTVETGWLGLGTYLWWMWASLALGLRGWRLGRRASDKVKRSLALLSFTLSAAILGWQCAGVVEYNFGDAEIRLIAFFYMGVLLAIGNRPAEKTLVERSSA